MELRKDKLVTGHYYHVYSRSIAGFEVFNDAKEYSRFLVMIDLYRYSDFHHKFSRYFDLNINLQNSIRSTLAEKSKKNVEIIAYCVMPTHFHLILKQTAEGGISIFLAKVLNSYARYFNLKHRRHGHLWAGRFKSVLVEDDDQMLHLTRYLHLNPSSQQLVENPSEWLYSSYSEYIGSELLDNPICDYKEVLSISSKSYESFVLDRKDYQIQISKIKNSIIEDYSG